MNHAVSSAAVRSEIIVSHWSNETQKRLPRSRAERLDVRRVIER